MDMKLIKKVFGVGLLTAAAITNSTAHAANASVTVDVNLPTVLVMYHYDTIDLTLDSTGLADYFFAGTNVACSGAGTCQTSPDLTQAALVLDGSGTTTVAGSLTDPGLTANTTTTFTLTDVVGVRAFGCAAYTAGYTDLGSDPSVTITPGPITDIEGQPCGFALTTGDLAFDLDFTAIPASAAPVTVQAVFDVTITGA